jgi:large exoprotein involved in heme utilization and adhesion
VTVSYERVDPGPDDDLRTPDQVINDFLRQGVRVSYRGPYALLGAGIRSGDEGDDPTVSVTAGLSHPNMFGGVYAGVSATGFSSAITDGVFAQARAGRQFGAGHSLELSAGALVVDENAIEDLTTTGWVRGAVWIELPLDLFGRAELEYAIGESRSGHRVSLGAGYRF